MRKFIILSAALLLSSASTAEAQLLEDGVVGTASGAAGGTSASGPVGSSTRSTTTGTLGHSTESAGSHSINTKSGAIHADRSVQSSTDSHITHATSTPGSTLGSDAANNAAINGSGSIDAQLVGTDAVRDAVDRTHRTGQGIARGVLSGAGRAAGGLAGAAAGSGNGSVSGSGGSLSLAGSAAAKTNGAFSVKRGTPVLALNGERIGKVRQVIADARGYVRQLLVKVDGKTAMLPASNFKASGSGNAVFSTMSQAQIKQTAGRQEATRKDGY